MVYISGREAGEYRIEGVLLTLASGLCAALGPGLIWWFRRVERLWLFWAGAYSVAGAAIAAFFLFA